jgi:DNA-binding transcriptional LysR family regulator
MEEVMHRRHVKKNVPMELLRALVTVVDTRSYTKAANALDVTQPAISSQIARLSTLFGGNLFAKGEGLTLTKRGAVVLQYARRLTEMNDELLATAGPHAAARQLTVGLPPWMGHDVLLDTFHSCSAVRTTQQVNYRCDRIERLVADLNAGLIDVAYLCNVMDPPRVIVEQFVEKMYWIKSPRLILGAGAPVPLVSWPGTNPDRVAVSTLQEWGMSHIVSFTAPDFSARLAGVAAGLGVMAVPARAITSAFEVITEGFPVLPGIKAGVFAREGLDLKPLRPFLRALTKALRPVPLTMTVATPSDINTVSTSSINSLPDEHAP